MSKKVSVCVHTVYLSKAKNKSIKACLYDAKLKKALKALALVYNLARILLFSVISWI